MKTIKIKNLSTLMDYAAVLRVAEYIAGHIYLAEYDYEGLKKIAKITRKGNTYIVRDAEE